MVNNSRIENTPWIDKHQLSSITKTKMVQNYLMVFVLSCSIIVEVKYIHILVKVINTFRIHSIE